jgi:hypothetical protein
MLLRPVINKAGGLHNMTHDKSPGIQMFDNLHLTPNRLFAIGAVTFSLALSGSRDPVEASAAPNTASAPNIAQMFDGTGYLAEASLTDETVSRAHSALSKPTCPNFGYAAICAWKVIKVENVSGTDQHPWIDCVRFRKSRLTQHITCLISNSKSNSVTAEVGGSAQVGFAALSAKVGYNVTRTTTLATSDTVDVPRRTAGVVQWAPVYGSLKKVTQENETCYETAPGVYDTCVQEQHPKSVNLAYASTEKFSSPVFRVVGGR